MSGGFSTRRTAESKPVDRTKHGRLGLSGGQRIIAVEFVRFVVLRAVCAVFSYGLYLLLLLWLRYEAAYVIAFLAGIGLAYVVSAVFVFQEPMRKRSAFRFPFVYLLQFVLCLVLLRAGVELIGIPEALALAFAVGITLPLTFLLSRWIVRAG